VYARGTLEQAVTGGLGFPILRYQQIRIGVERIVDKFVVYSLGDLAFNNAGVGIIASA